MTNIKTLHTIKLLIISTMMSLMFAQNLLAKSTQSQKTTLNSSSTNNCKIKQDEFRRLYLELQAKYLNYEGKDTTFDSKGNIVLVPHKANAPYAGKEFEEAIFKEYLNSVSKVAKLFQDAKFRPEISKPNTKLIDFISSIDSDKDTFINDSSKEIADIVEMLYQESNKRYKSSADAKYALTERDKYLLKKLVTHAQDRLCSVNFYDKNREKTKYFTKTELHQQMNAPINRIIYAIREAKITDKDRIVLYEPDQLMVNGKEAVHSAIKAHINDIAKFVRENNACIARIKDLNFLQKNIQPCNYKQFIESLQKAPGEFSELESILHFINANDHFFDYVKKTAETDLDPEILEMRTKLRLQREDGEDVLTQLACSTGKNEKGEEAIFLRNMPSKPGTNDEPDTSIIECFDAKTNAPVNAQKCQQIIKVESDYIGRGLVVKTVEQKNSKMYKFSIKGKPECSQIINNDLTGPNENLLQEDPNNNDKKCALGQVFDKEKKQCVPITAGFCANQGLILDPQKEQCIEDPNANKCEVGFILDANKKCVKDPSINICLKTEYLNADKKCTPIDEQYCISQDKIFDPKEKICIKKTDKTDKDCIAGEIFDEVTKQCLKDPNQNNQCPENQEKDDKGICIPKKDKNEKNEKADCEKKNDEWLANQKANGEFPKNRYVWEDDTCVDKNKKVKTKTDAAAAPIERPTFNDGPAPARFTPIQIPQRRFYVLPGMP